MSKMRNSKERIKEQTRKNTCLQSKEMATQVRHWKCSSDRRNKDWEKKPNQQTGMQSQKG